MSGTPAEVARARALFHLEWVRIHLEQGEYHEAARSLERARALIEEMGL